MQDWPLVVTNIIDHAAKFHGEQLVVTCTVEGPVHQYTYADMRRRSQLCALAMRQLGVGCVPLFRLCLLQALSSQAWCLRRLAIAAAMDPSWRQWLGTPTDTWSAG